jgi:hypothetical protein
MAQTTDLDELFGRGEGAPKPRLGRVYALLVLGLAFATIGLGCTAAPGGLLVLAAWMLVERETDRVESGFLPADSAPDVARARSRTRTGLLLILGLFVVQGVLLCSTDFYGRVYKAAADLVLPEPS